MTTVKRKYLKNGYVLPVPQFEIDEDYPKQKSCFIDTNRQDNIEYNLGNIEEEKQKIR